MIKEKISNAIIEIAQKYGSQTNITDMRMNKNTFLKIKDILGEPDYYTKERLPNGILGCIYGINIHINKYISDGLITVHDQNGNVVRVIILE